MVRCKQLGHRFFPVSCGPSYADTLDSGSVYNALSPMARKHNDWFGQQPGLLLSSLARPRCCKSVGPLKATLTCMMKQMVKYVKTLVVANADSNLTVHRIDATCERAEKSNRPIEAGIVGFVENEMDQVFARPSSDIDSLINQNKGLGFIS